MLTGICRTFCAEATDSGFPDVSHLARIFRGFAVGGQLGRYKRAARLLRRF